ncbi:uncharacterized protein LOC116408797 [Xenopus tropicalis]|uniref:Uncharacterized protein LOC116408797 n=1 Tax=Xenopus tropicalis TaxID=8364 RepID=A0A8J1J3V3_XENTR|nr:uncharacterized protein LOC116408797 [Xenopus tropicalis]
MRFTYLMWFISGLYILCIDPVSGLRKGQSDVMKKTPMAIEESNDNESSSGYLKYLIAMGVLIPIVLMGGLGWYLFVKQKEANWNFDMEKGKPTCPQTPTETKKVIKTKPSVKVIDETQDKAKKEEKQTKSKSKKQKKKTPSMEESLAKEEIQNEMVGKEETPRPPAKKIKRKKQTEIKTPEEETAPSVVVNKDEDQDSALKETEHSIKIKRLPLGEKEESDIDSILPLLAQFLKERSPSVCPVHRRFEFYEWTEDIGEEEINSEPPPASFTQVTEDSGPSYTIVRHMQWVHEVPDESEGQEKKEESPRQKKQIDGQTKKAMKK